MIAICSPFHNGDILWTVPTARELARVHDAEVDFWVSVWAKNCADLLLAQDFTRRVVVDEDFTSALGREHWMGNAESPDHGYLRVCQLGFRGHFNVPIPEYYCRLVGIGQQPNKFDLPAELHPDDLLPAAPFVCLASKGPADMFHATFRDFVKRCPHHVVEVGYPGEVVATDLGAWDRTSDGFVRMAQIISMCKWFVGTLSAPLVVASGFSCLKVGVHDGVHWDMTQVVYTDRHRYVVAGGGDAGPILGAL